MATYTSNVTRITGLSGFDTETAIEQLMEAESAKYKSLQKEKTWKTWQQEAYRNIISSLQSFQSKFLQTGTNSIRYSTTFNNFKKTVTDANGEETKAITVNKATGSGNYEVEVVQSAKAEAFKGSSGAVSNNIKTGKTAAEITASIEKYGSISFNASLDGVAKKISISADEIAGSDVTSVINSKLSKAFGSNKVNASVNSDGNIEFATIGDGHAFSISAAGGRESTATVSLDNVKDLLIKDGDGKYSFEFDFMVDTDDGESITFNAKAEGILASSIEDEAGNIDEAKLAKAVANAMNKASTTKEVNGKEKTIKASAYLTASATEDGQLKLTSKSEKSDLNIGGGIIAADLNHTSSFADLGLEGSTSDKITTATKLSDIMEIPAGGLVINDNVIDIDENTTVKDLMNKLSNAGVNMTYSSINRSFTIESKTQGENGSIDFGDGCADFFSKLGIDITTKSGDNYTAGRDATIKIDGVETTRTTNTFNLEEVNITITDASVGKKFTISAEQDVDATYDKIKEFVDEYNKLIEDLNTQVKETRTKYGSYTFYDPLTDDEKAAMDDDEVEKWEKAAKTGLVYNDSSIKSMLSKMRSALYSGVDLGNGEKISLYEIGITTSSDYTDNGKLIIDEDKLKNAISTRGEDVEKLFTRTNTGLGDQFNSIVNNMIGQSGVLRAKAGIAGTSSVTENSLSKQIAELGERIDAEKERLYNKENFYYELFANMESTMNSQNSQLSALMGITAY